MTREESLLMTAKMIKKKILNGEKMTVSEFRFAQKYNFLFADMRFERRNKNV